MRERDGQNSPTNVIKLDLYRRMKARYQSSMGDDLFSIVSDISRKNSTAQAEKNKLTLVHPNAYYLQLVDNQSSVDEKAQDKKEAIILKFPNKRVSTPSK